MKLACIYLCIGLILGVIYGVCKHIVFVCKNNTIIQIILDIAFCCLLGYLTLSANNYYNMGEFRLYLYAFCALGFAIERKTIGKLFAKLFFMIYNESIKWIDKFKITRIGKIIFK